MKDGVIIINTGRRPLPDEEALAKGLRTGKLASAELDVYENEPNTHPELVNKKVMLLRQLGTTTVGTKREMELLAVRNLESALYRGEHLTPISYAQSSLMKYLHLYQLELLCSGTDIKSNPISTEEWGDRR
ncbi:hypothetical protein BDW75DRAFT_199272 [Aspergillus navahoensis]